MGKKDVSIILTDVRTSYLYGYAPFKSKNDSGEETAKYTVHGIFDKGNPNEKIVKDALRKAAALEWGEEEGNALLKIFGQQDRLCLHQGDVSKRGKAEYAGRLFVSATNSNPYLLLATVNGVNVEVNKAHKFALYSGCRANIMMDIYAQNNKWGQRMNATVTGVQFVAHDVRLGGGGRVASLSEFGVVAGDADSAVPETADASDLF